jgi:y4mF family transcriptional regulator
MRYASKDIGELIKTTRNEMGITQKELALTSGTGIRFIIELEQGKDTCQLGKVLNVLQTLGIKINFNPPAPLKGI